MEISIEKAVYISVVSIFFTIVFIPLVRYFVINYFSELKTDISEIKDEQKNILIMLNTNIEKIYDRFILTDNKCSDMNAKIAKLEGRINGK